jgi:hypothetical protein
MTLTEFYDAVARRADTDKTRIGAAETRRVLSEAFLVLGALNAAELAAVLHAGLNNAKAKAARKAPAASAAPAAPAATHG